LRRLTRLQYENTIHDLLAIDLKVQNQLPEDNRSFGFDNVGEALTLSGAQLDAYLEAADAVLDAAIVKHPKPRTLKRRLDCQEALNPRSHAEEGDVLDLEDVAVKFGPGPMLRFGNPEEGRYRFRASVYGYQSQSDPVEIFVQVNNYLMPARRLTIGYLDAPPQTPTVIEFTARLVKGDIVEALAHKLPRISGRPNGTVDLRTYRGPGLALEWVEVEGPLVESWPPASHTRLFGDLPLRSVSPQTLEVFSEQPRLDAARLLPAFMRRAYRRPVSAAEAQPFVDLVVRQLANKKSFEQAMRVGYKAVLASPGFLFFRDMLGETDDWALAARLSYFLWNRAPDDELSQLAERGVLSRPEILRSQVERLLNHVNARAFVDNFVAQWLELRLIDFTVPDKKLYPELARYPSDVLLRESIVQETQLFFEEILKRDLSLANFVDADFSVLNERLAQHYGITGVKGSALRVVKLPPASRRGGVLTHASVLKVTANGSTTSPVVRGAWVLRNILGKPTDPPPPDAGAIEPDIRGAQTIRELLDKHRVPSCARCHAKIDPLGFAQENFDVLGRWRERYRVLSGPNLEKPTDGPPVAADYQLPDGRDIRNINDLKKLLLEDKDQLARALAGKLLIYATGRGPRFSDRAVIKEIVSRLRTKNYGLRSLIHEVVQSRAFLNP